jgi:hypothetical protein
MCDPPEYNCSFLWIVWKVGTARVAAPAAFTPAAGRETIESHQQPGLRTLLSCRLRIAPVRATPGLQECYAILEALDESQHLLLARSEGRPASQRN